MAPRLSGLVRPGDGGAGVLELQRLLVAAGYTVSPAELESFGPITEAAVRAFQVARGLRVDGICGPETRGALVESGYRLGDRLLYRRHPMLRGDDVGELQQRLNALGFDAGRVDAILGPHSERAVREFQRNTGLAVDGVCGPETLRALGRVGAFAAGSVAVLREREALRQPGRELTGRSIYLAVDPGFGVLAQELASGLTGAGAEVFVDVSDSLDSQVAAVANDQGADLLFGLSFGDAPGCSCDYFASRSFRSEAGYRVANRVLDEL
ncbi:MAG: peptidoglycan-binding protein, partial [Acidimicrobiia bacterium]